jgi:hypothetical protein
MHLAGTRRVLKMAMSEAELLAAKLENANNISLHVWDPIHSWTEEVSLTAEQQSAIVAALREIERLQAAKRAALKLADERAIEANGLRQVVDWVDTWVSNPVGSYSVAALDGLFAMTRDRIAALTDENGK